LIEEGLLIKVLPQYEAEPMPVSLLYPSRRQPPKRLIVFMDWLQSIMIKKPQRVKVFLIKLLEKTVSKSALYIFRKSLYSRIVITKSFK